MLKLQSQARQEETEAELALIEQRGSFEGLSASLRSEAAVQDVHRWVNDIRALFRPILTLLLVGVVTWMSYQMLQGDGDMLVLLGETKTSALLEYTITSLTFAASTAIVWWFGDRAMKNQFH